VIEIGYSILAAHRQRGFATEAVATLVEHAFLDPRVTSIAAETFPDLPASIGVLERNHFTLCTAPGRGGALRYERRRV